MRNLLDWLAAKLGYVRPGPRSFARIDNGTDAVARGQRWEQFYAEEGGIQDMILAYRHGLFQRVSALGPSDTDKIMALSIADKVARELDGKVRDVIETGKIEAFRREEEQRFAAIAR
jgi:hypothetical protein